MDVVSDEPHRMVDRKSGNAFRMGSQKDKLATVGILIRAMLVFGSLECVAARQYT